jgi:hypothetical protein
LFGSCNRRKSAAVKLHQPENSKDVGRKSVDSYQYGGDENVSGCPARSRGGVEAGGDEQDPPCNDEDRIGIDLPVNNKEVGSTVNAAVQLTESKLTRSDVEQQGFSTPVKQGGPRQRSGLSEPKLCRQTKLQQCGEPKKEAQQHIDVPEASEGHPGDKEFNEEHNYGGGWPGASAGTAGSVVIDHDAFGDSDMISDDEEAHEARD